MNLKGLGEFYTPLYPTGAVEYAVLRTDISKLKKVVTCEDKVDFDKFYKSVTECYSSMVLSAMAENRFKNEMLSQQEERNLESYVPNSLLSSVYLRHDSNANEIIKAGVQDLDNVYMVNKQNLQMRITNHIAGLKVLDKVHQYFAYRKCLVKCDFIKWNSDISEVLEKLVSEEKFSQLSEWQLRDGLEQHLFLLREWKNGEGVAEDLVGTGKQSGLLENFFLEAINQEYCQELARVVERLLIYEADRDIEHRNFVTKCADKELKTSYLPQTQKREMPSVSSVGFIDLVTRQVIPALRAYLSENQSPRPKLLQKIQLAETSAVLKNQAVQVSMSWMRDKMFAGKYLMAGKPRRRLLQLGVSFGAAATLTTLTSYLKFGDQNYDESAP